MRRSLIQINDLLVGYRKRSGQVVEVIRRISLDIERGKTLGLVGESGCGKTTVCLSLLGHFPAGNSVLGGTVRFDGLDIFSLGRKELQNIRGKRIGLIPQNAWQSLNPTMRVGAHIVEALVLHRKLAGAEAHAQTIELLDRVLLPEPEILSRRYPHELSGGQQQRVAIALALAAQPEMLVLDEPTTGLDMTTKVRIIDLLKDIQRENCLTMLYVSHDFGEIARISDSIAVMYAGEVVEFAPATELFTQPAHPYTRALLESIPHLSVTGIPKSIQGRPPALGEHAGGCSFAPRCAFASDVCTTVTPLLEPGAQESHLVQCHHWQQVLRSESSLELQPGPHKIDVEPVIELAGVEITYARPSLLRHLRRLPEPPAAVSDVTLTVHRGETLALVGESGSGKTTVVRAIAGLQPVRKGRITFGDFDLLLDVGGRPRELCRRIQMIFQNPDASLNPRHSVVEIIERPLKLYFKLSHKERLERAEALLRQVRLGPQYLFRYPGQMSGGEKQRVAIARAFAAEPTVVLCDEVTSSLDVSIQAAILALLAELQAERGVAYIIVAHDLALVRSIADHVAVLYRGRLCEVGAAAQVFAPPYHPYTEELMRAAFELNGVPERAQDGLLPFVAGEAVELAPHARGCPYQHRCARRIGPICENEPPPWQAASVGHKIRCHIPVAELLESKIL